jgi:hypothetical protein
MIITFIFQDSYEMYIECIILAKKKLFQWREHPHQSFVVVRLYQNLNYMNSHCDCH